MSDILRLPTGPLVDASLALVRVDGEPADRRPQRPILSFRALACRHEGCLNDAAYDEELLSRPP